jgi:hypothetical protein
MAQKVKDLIAYLSKLDQEDLVRVFIIEKADVNFVGTIKDEDWGKILDASYSEYGEQIISEKFSEAIHEVLGEYYCDSCSDYDYETMRIDDEDLCRACGEESEVVT